MSAPLIAVTGVGTGVGKTHVAEALVRHWALKKMVCGFKPIETGVTRALQDTDDGARLEQASTFHVKHLQYGQRFSAPLSPNIAAAAEGRSVDLATIIRTVDWLRSACDGVVVELAGGLFTPLDESSHNLELISALRPTATVLVASDRLGVLHDVIATTTAAPKQSFVILLSAPPIPDLSTGTNTAELRRRLLKHTVYEPIPRANPSQLTGHASIEAIVQRAQRVTQL